MIEALISSKTRIKLLFKFFLNRNTTAYLRSLEQEFGESTNSIRIELNRFEKAGMLASFSEGNKKVFKANTKHPLFDEIHRIVRKHLGLDHIIDNILTRLGQVEKVYLVGPLANGKDVEVIELVLVGKVIDIAFLESLILRAEDIVKRKIKYEVMDTFTFKDHDWSHLDIEPLVIWENG